MTVFNRVHVLANRAVPLILAILLLLSAVVVVHPRAAFADPAVTTVTVCDTATVTAAIADGGEILLDCGANSHTVVLTEQFITVDTTLDIVGPPDEGPNYVSLSGNNANRLFTVASGVSLTLRDVVLIDGAAGEHDGGAIYNSGNLTLERGAILQSSAISGGGIFNDGGTVTVDYSDFNNNIATDAGGAISSGGTLNLTRSTFYGNTATSGAGIDNDGGSLTVDETTFWDNSATSYGGGIYNEGTATLERIAFMGNQSLDEGGAIVHNAGTLSVTHSSFEYNSAVTYGGAISNFAELSLENASVFGSEAANGAGIATDAGSLSLRNVTIAQNAATTGGGLLLTSGSATLANTLIGDNSATDSTADCSGTLTSAGYNLIEDATGCTLGGDATGLLTGVDAQLAFFHGTAYGEDGYAPLGSSAAINAGNPGGSGDAACTGDDQIGTSRPQGQRCDIGAYEFIDTVAPTSSGAARWAANQWGWYRTSVSIDISAIDDASGVGVEDFLVTKSGAESGPGRAVSGNSAALGVWAEGETTVSWQARDRHGNTEASHSVTIQIDKTLPTTTAPVLTLTPHGQLRTLATAATIAWTGADDRSGVSIYQVERSVDSGLWTSLIARTTAETGNVTLAPGHTYQFRVRAVDRAGNRGTWSEGPAFTLALYQDDDDAVEYQPVPWTLTTSGTYSGSTAHESSTVGRSVTFDFDGTGVAWVSSTGPKYGRVEVFIDDQSQGVIDMYTATAARKQLAFTQDNLTDGPHRLKLVILAGPNPASTGNRVEVDAFLVVEP